MRYLVVSLLVAVFGYLGILNPIRDSYGRFVAPLQFGMRHGAITLKDSIQFFGHIKDVRNQNLQLSQEILDLKAEVMSLKRVQEENVILKEQLHVGDEVGKDRGLILAEVMGNPSDMTRSSVYLNRGARDGIHPGDNVIRGRYLVGIVREVTSERSLVDLITAPSVAITVYDVDAPEKTEGLAVGQYGSFVLLKRVLPSERLEVGDVIVTSGRDGFFYPGLYVGEIADVSTDVAQPLKTATVSVLSDIFHLEKVFVLKME